MPVRELGLGVIGAGAIAPLHIAAIGASSGGRLVAVSDVLKDKAEQLGKQNGVPWYIDHREMLANPDVDAVCVCTPSGLRGDICIDAARAGKHIIAEKPLEVTLSKIDAVIDTCERCGVKLGVIFQNRFLAPMAALKRAVAEGRLGKLLMGNAYIKWQRPQEYYDSASWRGTWEIDGGGALMNQGIHYVDLLQWMMGPVESVFGYTDTLARLRIDVEDTAVACLRFRSGAMGSIEACTSASTGTAARLEVRGDRGVVVIEDGGVVLWSVIGEDPPALSAVTAGSGASNPMAISTIGHERQIQDMIEAIANNRPPAVDGREGRKAIEIISAIYQSSTTRRMVELPLPV